MSFIRDKIAKLVVINNTKIAWLLNWGCMTIIVLLLSTTQEITKIVTCYVFVRSSKVLYKIKKITIIIEIRL